MAVYGIGLFTMREMHPDMVEYLDKLGETLAPYGGKMLIHGGKTSTIEGEEWTKDVVVIEFADQEKAEGWYYSDAYQAILRYRTDHIDGEVFLVDGVPDGYDPKQKAEVFRNILAGK
ncbi:DUF1330 domain-containing protein [Salininema proteolyticum]|uniref:DUF1330 domain-containing protein n=1 Tax=Salininema proteolyticum TaxID=1607685 RepID=A0ABV8U0M0_9ACTN